MPELTVRIKTKSGQLVVDSLSGESSILQLKQHVAPWMGTLPENVVLMMGYPPKSLDFETKTLSEVGIKSGETLIAQERVVPVVAAVPTNSNAVQTTENNKTRHHIQSESFEGCGFLMRQVVPADNSCLFTSVGFVLSGKVDTTCGTHMRKIIAESVAADPELYSEAILGKPNKQYCEWICKPDSWGGAIELAVLSNFYAIEIAVVDTINAVINRFGEDMTYPFRVFLIFDGIHYDPLYKESLKGDNEIQTMFPSTNEKVLIEAAELAQEAKSSRQYTDVNKFTLRCLVCHVELRGQNEAQQHAQTTKHTNFGEIAS